MRETRLTYNWQTYFVVFSGSYIYFYRAEQDLLPFHYLYAMSISSQSLASRPRGGQQLAKQAGRFAETKDSQEGSAHGGGDALRKPLGSGSPSPQRAATLQDEEAVDSILILRGRNGEQVSLNFGKSQPRHRRGRSRVSSPQRQSPAQSDAGTALDPEAASASSAGSRGSGDSPASSSSARGGSKRGPPQWRREVQESEQSRAAFQVLIDSKQKEFRGAADLADGALPVHREAVSSLIRPEIFAPDQYYQQSSFRLALFSKSAAVRLFQEDFELMNDAAPDYDRPGCIWSYVRASNIGLELDI